MHIYEQQPVRYLTYSPCQQSSFGCHCPGTINQIDWRGRVTLMGKLEIRSGDSRSASDDRYVLGVEY